MTRILILAVCLAAWSPTFAAEKGTLSLGVMLPLSGSAAFYGEWGMKGMSLAAEEINSAGGIRGRALKLSFEDSKNDPKEGVTLAHKLLSGNAALIISAMTGVSFAALPVVEKKKSVLFMTIVTHPEATKNSRWAFRHYVNKGKAAETMAAHAAKDLKLKTAGILYINDEGGMGEKTAFVTAFQRAGGKVVAEEGFEKTETNLRNQILKIAEAHPEAVYISGYGRIYGLAIKQIRELGFAGRILASYEPLYKATRELAGDAIEGVVFTAPPFEVGNPSAKAFMERFEKRFGVAPELDAAFAYDVVRLAARALEKGGVDAGAVRRALLATKDYEGAVGRVTVRPNGDTEIPIMLRRVRGGIVESAVP